MMEISKKKKAFIKKNCQSMSVSELARRLNIKKAEVQRIIKELNLDTIAVTDKEEEKEWAIFSERKEKSKFWHAGGIILILIVLLCIFFWKTIFLGEVLTSTDAIFSYHPWKSVAPEGYIRPSNYLHWDEFFIGYPLSTFYSEVVKNGDIQFWNPYIMCGYPGRLTLYPIWLLYFLILSLYDFYGIYVITKFFIVGIFTYIFLRSISEKIFGSLVSAIVFMFSGFMVGFAKSGATSIAALLPLLFFLTEKLVQKNSYIYIFFLSLVIGIGYSIGGFHPILFHVLLALGIYFVFRVIVEYRRENDKKIVGKIILSFLLANIAGFFLASIQMLPSLEFLQEGSELAARTGVRDLGEGAAYGHLGLKSLILLFIPNFFGNPVDGNAWEHLLKMRNFIEQSLYIGIFPLILAITGVIFLRKNSKVIFFFGLGFLSLCVVYGIPGVFHLVVNLPGFNLIKNTRLILIFTFAFSVLAGMGANFLAYQLDREKREKILKFIFSPINLIILTIFIFLIFQYQYFLGERIYAVLVKNNITDYIWKYSILFVTLLGLTIAIIALRSKDIIKLKGIQVFILSVIVIDLFIFGIRWCPTIKKENIYPITESISFLKKDPGIFRIAALGKTLVGNSNVPYKLFDIRGHTGNNLQRYEEFITRKCCERTFFYFMSNVHPQINLMNVKYLLFPPDANFPESERFTRVFDRDLRIYRNNSYFPRSFIVHRAEVVKDDKLILERLYDPNFDPRHFIVLEKDIPEELQKLKNTPLEDSSSAEITKYENNSVLINAKMENPGFLFLSDNFYPDWKAYINEEEREIFRADYTFRAVFLEKGDHVVEFKYEPESFQKGLYLSLITAVILLGILVWGVISEKRGKSKRKTRNK